AWLSFIPKTARATKAGTGAGSNEKRWLRPWKKSRLTSSPAKLATSSTSAATTTFSKSKKSTAATPKRLNKPGPTAKRNCFSSKHRICRNAGSPACARRPTSRPSEQLSFDFQRWTLSVRRLLRFLLLLVVVVRSSRKVIFRSWLIDCDERLVFLIAL